MVDIEFDKKVKELIDGLKAVCSVYGLSGDGNEYKVITQVFLYKFLNDKFAYEVKKIDKNLASTENWEKEFSKKTKDEIKLLQLKIGADTAKFEKKHFISTLFEKQNDNNFSEMFDDTLIEIASNNIDVFSIKRSGGEKDALFERISQFINERNERNSFCKSLINKLVGFSFEQIFNKKFDFYSTIFEYLIKDYNTNSGGAYAEYFTPHAVSKVMASCLVDSDVVNASCYDPSAGSGTLLMNLANEIGVDKCTIYSQDISQKSSQLLRLNLILNNLVHSMPNIVQGNTILNPFHQDGSGEIKKFDYIVSNPPFKLDFSDYRDALDTKENQKRFFAGIPNIPPKDKKKMAIYLLFIQHIVISLTDKGKAAIVVPTGFLTATSIGLKIREYLIENKIFRGAISMPTDIFADTGTNVSIIFIDKNYKEDPILINASNLGKVIKIGKKQKTIISENEEELIIDTFLKNKAVENFSVKVTYEEIKNKRHSFSAGQYFKIKIDHIDISKTEFQFQLKDFKKSLEKFTRESNKLENEINESLLNLEYND